MIKLKRNSYVGMHKMFNDLRYLFNSGRTGRRKVKLILKFKTIDKRSNGNTVCKLQLVGYADIVANTLITLDYAAPTVQIIKTYTPEMQDYLVILQAQIDNRSLRNKQFIFDMINGMPTGQIRPQNLIHANELNQKQIHNHITKPGPKVIN